MQIVKVCVLGLIATGACQFRTGRMLSAPSYPVPISVESMDRRVAIMKMADVVVAGEIDEEPRRAMRVMTSPIGGFLDYVQVPVRVAVSVRGGASGRVFFGAYCYSTQNVRELGVQSFQPKAGEKRIFFLRWDNGVLRSVGDVLDYSIVMFSGSHRANFCDGRNEERCMAELFLKPQPDVSKTGFLRSLISHSMYAVGLLSGPKDAIELLRELSRSPDLDVAARAEEALEMAAVWWPAEN